jgi:dihydrofolate reductase
MKISAFVATSLDGFIARPDGSLDWLERAGGGDYGYQAFFDSIDALVIGRHTYEQATRLDPWPYGFKRVFVLSSGFVQVPDNLVRFVESTQYAPQVLVPSLAQAGIKHLYVDGGQTIQSFMRAGLLSELTINRLPILLGQGVPLFGALKADLPLTVSESQTLDNGVVQTRYRFGAGAQQ